jgi:hypothetical protein
MCTAERPPPGGNADEIADGRAGALDVVSDVLLWRLAAGRWDAVGQMLAAMEAALAAGDGDGLMAATAGLEVAGPPRTTRIGAVPVVPPPAQVRYLLNRLVHELGGVTAPTGEEDWAAETGDGDAARR